MRATTKTTGRLCSICGNPEAPKHIDQRCETIFCLGHTMIPYYLWNLSPSLDGSGLKINDFKSYQRHLRRINSLSKLLVLNDTEENGE